MSLIVWSEHATQGWTTVLVQKELVHCVHTIKCMGTAMENSGGTGNMKLRSDLHALHRLIALSPAPSYHWYHVHICVGIGVCAYVSKIIR